MNGALKKSIAKYQLSVFLLIHFMLSPNVNAETNVAIEPVFGAANVVQVVLSLVLILILVVGLAWLVKRLQMGSLLNDKRQMRVVSALNLGGRERLLVVQVGDKQMLIGAAPGHVSYIKDLDALAKSGVAQQPDNDKRFFTFLSKAREQTNTGSVDD